MKRTKRGFTIVELVIVIAIIAILAAILVPTFSSVIDNAKKTSRASEIKSCYTEYVNSKATDSNATIGAIESYVYAKDGANYEHDGDAYTLPEGKALVKVDENNNWIIYSVVDAE